MELITVEKLNDLLQSNNFDLKPTQPKLCLPIIQRIYRKMMVGIVFDGINVKDSLIINGHHRYICSLLAQQKLVRNPWESPPSINQYDWHEIEVVCDDYDSAEEIRLFNERDASNMGWSIDDLEKLIKIQ